MNFEISTDKSKIQIDTVYRFLSVESFWAKGRPKELIQKSIDHSICFSIFDGQSQQVGFARVVSDQSTFAYLSDVYIDIHSRGKGLSTRLMKAILNHPELKDINRWMLLTKDAHKLYEKFDFKESAKADWIMERVLKDI